MNSRSEHSGFSVVEVIIALLVVGILGFLGYAFYTHQVNKPAVSSATKSQPATTSDVQSAPTINSTADLSSAETMLDNANISGSNGSDSNQLNSELANF